MADNPYSSVSISGYNTNPPADDGSQVASNQLTWAKHKDKLGDPLKNLSESVNTNVLAAFAKTINTDADQNNSVAGSIAFTNSELTISGGSITVVRSHHTVDTQSDASSDDLTTIVNTGTADGAVLYLRAENVARAVKIDSGAGNIFILSGDKQLTINHSIQLLRVGTNWYEVNSKRKPVNIAEMTGYLKATLAPGDRFDVDGYYAAGDGGGGSFSWVSTATETANGGSIIAADEAGTGRFESISEAPLTWKQFGAKGDNTQDDTAFIQAAIDAAAADGFVNGTPNTFKVTGDPAIQIDQSYHGITVDFKGAKLHYGTATGVCLELGAGETAGASRLWRGKFIGLRVERTIATPYETGLLGTGIRLNNVAQSSFKDTHIRGFRKALSLNPQAEADACTGNTFVNTDMEEYIIGYHLEAAAVDNCYVTQNNFLGGFMTVSTVNFTNVATADARNIEILWPGFANSGNSMNGNLFQGLNPEPPLSRKLFCQGPGNKFDSCYWDTGVLLSGNTHVSGNFPYAQTGITGFTSNGTSVITKVAHGLTPFIIGGDWITVISGVDISDNQTYHVDAIDVNTITLHRSLAGTGALTTIAHLTCNIEFTGRAERCIISDGQRIGLQTISDRAVGGIVYDSEMGIVKGPKPGLGARGVDSNPGGAIDAGQNSLINMVGTNILSTQDFNSYLGNMANNDTDGSFQLCFVAADGNNRPSVMSSIRANKEGRSSSQAHGGIQLRTRAAGSNTYLVTGVDLDSNQNVLCGLGGHAPTATTGHFYMPITTGAPTGVPDVKSGFVAFTYDDTGNQLYVYDTGSAAWLKTAALT